MKDSTQFAVIAAGLGVLAFVLYKASGKISDAAGAAVGAVGDAVQAVNPLNHDNVIAGGVNKVGAVVSGDSSFSLGTWLYNITHADENVTAPTKITDSGTRYAKPPSTTNGTSDSAYLREAPAMSFYGGASFKDLADPYAVNAFIPLTLDFAPS